MRRGKRKALPNSEVMIHQPAGGTRGQATDILRFQARQMLRVKEQLARILAQRTEQDVEKLRLDMERDFYMSAETAKEYGVIDEVIPAKR